MPLVNRNNLKQQPIPVVPRTMRIVNGDGTVTRSGQLLLEQLQDMGELSVEDLEEATFVIYDTAVASNVTNLLPVQRGGIAVAADIVPKGNVAADFTFDILITRVGQDFATTRNSIFGTDKLTVPAGTDAGTVITQDVFVTNPFELQLDDILSSDILASDGTNVYTIVLRWRV